MKDIEIREAIQRLERIAADLAARIAEVEAAQVKAATQRKPASGV